MPDSFYSTSKESILYKDECYKIQGAAFEVYKEMGSGFLEAIYQECMVSELSERKIPHTVQPQLSICYKNKKLEHVYIPDIICYEKIIIELKAVKKITPEHQAQTFNYLKASNMKLALIINFGHYPKVEIKRIIL